VHQISKYPRLRNGSQVRATGLLEETHDVVKLLKWLPAGPTSNGGHREHTLVQFVAREGGIRTVNVKDLILL
jgi:hypothetical protein